MHGRNILDLTRELAARFPGRGAGRRVTEQCANAIADCFSEISGVDFVKSEAFVCHPRAFFSWCKASGAAYLISALLLINGYPFAGFLIMLGMLGFAVTVFGIYDDFFDRFFPMEMGKNVFAVIEPEGKARQQVVISSHHDAAPIFLPLELAPKLYLWLMRGAAAVYGIHLLIALGECFFRLPGWVDYMVLGGGVFMLPVVFLTGTAISPGAGDNLVSSCLLVELAKELAARPLKHTQVILASLDAEECGMRGSAAFLKRHPLNDLPCRAIVVDTIYRRDDLAVFTKDLNGTVSLSRELANELMQIQPMKHCSIPPGGGATDAANFAKAGIPSVTITAMETNPAKWSADFPYHTSRDSTEAIEASAVDAVFELLVNYMRTESAVNE